MKHKNEKYSIRNNNNPGKVIIVGFGPGDPELLTIKAFRALESADVIFHDALIDVAFIQRFRAKKINVGKRKHNHSHTQEEINRLLYHSAKQGRLTVRLKGGDPAIFGRVGEETAYLLERGIITEIIPGITTASAASALTGIPLTQRKKAGSVSFYSGHNIENTNLPRTDTIVFYMGGSVVDSICRKMIINGWEKSTPLAIISNVSKQNQEIFISSIGKTLTFPPAVKTPALIIAGNTINKEMINAFIQTQKQTSKPLVFFPELPQPITS